MTEVIITVVSSIISATVSGVLVYFITKKCLDGRKKIKTNEQESVTVEQESVTVSFKECDYVEKIKQAKNCIFINSSVLHILTRENVRYHLAKAKSRVEINLFPADLNDNVTFESARRYAGVENLRGKSDDTSKFIKIIKGEHEDIKHTNIFIHASYFAIDYKGSGSPFIEARYYLLTDIPNVPQFFYIIAKPGTELYETYLNQIKLIEEKEGKVGYI